MQKKEKLIYNQSNNLSPEQKQDLLDLVTADEPPITNVSTKVKNKLSKAVKEIFQAEKSFIDACTTILDNEGVAGAAGTNGGGGSAGTAGTVAAAASEKKRRKQKKKRKKGKRR